MVHWSSPRLRPFIFTAAAVLSLFASDAASAQDSYLLRDSGRMREYQVSPSEIHVVRPAAPAEELKAAITAAEPGATVSDPKKGRALVLSAGGKAPASVSARAAALTSAVPGSQVEAVLYPKDGPRTELTRRIMTPEVLVPVPAGETPATIAISVGASSLREVKVPGYTMLRFPDGFAALEATRKLESRGIKAEPQLRRLHAKRFTPNDSLFSNQWHLRNTGQSGGLFGIDANITPAWDITKGLGVTISVVDDGLETTHPDLDPNCPPIASGFHRDFNGGDNDPAPEALPLPADRHGTAVAGVAAARGNNFIGVSGAAPEAQLVGIRLISGPVTDAEEAQALFWSPAGLEVGVSNNSWGPTVYYASPDTLTKNALRDAAINGRGGRGQITIFSGGNSQADSDGARDTNGDGYSASRYVIAVGALNNFGVQSTYSQRGASLLVSAPSSDPFATEPRLGIWTTDNVGLNGYNPGAGEPSTAIDPNREYTNSFGGTSSSAPLAAGSIALMLASTPTLGWRDVHEIVAATAALVDAGDSDWVVNGGGFKFNHKYGGGMIDATAAVVRGKSWQNLPAEESESVAATALPAVIPDNNTAGITRSFDFSAFPNLRVERVEVLVRAVHNSRSDLEISLTSPYGTQSFFTNLRPRQSGTFDDDTNIDDNGAAWSFTTTHSWGENSSGVWTLRARDLRAGTAGSLNFATVRIYGTNSVEERVIFEAPAVTVNEADGTATIRVQRFGSATGAFSVDVLTAPQSTATAGADFDAVTQTLEFAEDEFEKEITIPILQDSNPEPVETIFLALVNPSSVALGGVTLTQISIEDDETRPVTISVTDATATEAPSEPGEIVITRPAADPTPLTVNISVGGTATNGADYTASIGTSNVTRLPTTVTIPPSLDSIRVRINPLNDNATEGTETVIVTLLPGLDYDVGPQSVAQVNIIDDERPAVGVEAPVVLVSEASLTPVNFIVRRNNSDATPLIVKLLVEGTARAGDNYIALPTQVEIPASASSLVVPLRPVNDTLYNPLKSVIVKIFPTQDYSESFNSKATINITEDDPLPDATRPFVTITSPKNKERFDALAVTPVVASGTARDNKSVSRVFYSVNEGARKTATNTTLWTADLTADLVPGPNKLSVQSQDAEGNLSTAAIVNFSFVRKRTLTVTTTTNGAPGSSGGTVTSSFLTPSELEAGQTYTITATPSAGFVFAGWSGGFTGLARTLTFQMPNANTTLTAAFVTDPFLSGIQGTYTGPVRSSTFAQESAGLLQVAVTARGAASGTLSLAGARLPFRGEFNGLGRLRVNILRTNSTPVLLDLTLDLTGPVRRITGTAATTSFTSNVFAERAGFSASTPYAPAAAKPEYYTFVIPAGTGVPAFQYPAGTGHGTLTIDASGNVKWTATLPDQTVVSGGAPLAPDLSSAFFASLYGNKGLTLGELRVNKAAATTDFTGTFDWVKPENPRDRTFPLGFSRLGATIEGSLYAAPATPATQTVFKTPATTTGAIQLTRGNITTATGVATTINEVFKLGFDHKVIFNGTTPPQGLIVTIDPVRGLFSGTFVDAKFPRRTLRPFRGVIVQKQQLGWGGLLGGTITGAALQTGTVKLDP